MEKRKTAHQESSTLSSEKMPMGSENTKILNLDSFFFKKLETCKGKIREVTAGRKSRQLR